MWSVILSNNALSRLDPSVLSWWSVPVLHLDDNPWFCDCRLSWLAQLARNRSWSWEVSCNGGPWSLSGAPLSSLADTPLSCSREMSWSLPLLLVLLLAISLPSICLTLYMLAQAGIDRAIAHNFRPLFP